MKNLYFVLLFVIATAGALAQAPGQINYQAVARNAVGNVLPNQDIKLRLSIRDGGSSGPVVYQEIRSIKTNMFGMFNIAIGSPGATAVVGTINGVSWSNGSAKYLQVEMDPTGGSNWVNMGSSQLLSVPFALFAAGALPSGPAGGSLTGTYPDPQIATGAVGTSHIADKAVSTIKLEDGSVTTPKLADNAVTTPKITNGSVTAAKLAPGVIPTSLPPSGGAGGHLSGMYPNPTIADNAISTPKLQDGSVTLAKLAPGVINSIPPSGPAGGDLGSTYPNPTVDKLKGISLSNMAPTVGDVLKFDGAQWVPAPGGSGGAPSGPAGGELTGSYPNPSIALNAITNGKIADNAVTTTKIADASVTASKLAPGVIPTSLPPSGGAGGHLSGMYPNPTIADNAISAAKLQPNAVTTAKITDASVTAAKLAPGVIPTTLPPSGGATGDLSGTYPSPSVSKIQGVPVSTTAPANGEFLKFNGTQWVPAAGSGSGSPTGSAGGDLGANYPNPSVVGIQGVPVSTTAPSTGQVLRFDGVNWSPASGTSTSTPTGPAGGDLGSSYPNPSVVKMQGIPISATAPSTGQILKFDGVNWSPASGTSTSTPTGPAGGDLNGSYPNPSIAPQAVTTNRLASLAVTTQKIDDGAVTTIKLNNGAVTNAKLATDAVGTTNIQDASVTAAKLAPGVIPTSLPPSGAAGGDLGSTYPNPSVAKIQGVPVSATAPGVGQFLKFDGTQWIASAGGSGGAPTGPAGGDLTGTYPNPTVANNAIGTTKIIDASVTAAKLAPGVIPTSLPPSGAASGDLTGTYPAPTLANNAVTTAKISDASVTAAKLAPGVIPTTLPPSGAAGGDLGSTYPNPSVAKIQGVPVSATAPAAGQVLKFDGTQWIASAGGSGGAPTGPAGGDLTGTYPNPTIALNAVTNGHIADNAITTTKINDGSVTAAKLAPGVIPTSLPPSGAAGGDLGSTYPNPSVAKIQGVPVSATAPSIGQFLKFDGTQWIASVGGGGGTPTGPAGGDLAGTYPNPTVADNAIGTTKIIDASVTAAKLAPGVIPTSLPPSGAASGDLTGTYPAPTLANNAVTTAKISDASVTAAKLAPGVIPTTLPPSGAAGGDLGATYPNPSVAKIQGVPVSATAPAAGQFLKFDGTQWIASAGGGGGTPTGPAGGDLAGTYPNPTVADNAIGTTKIVDASVTAAKLAPGVIPTSLPPSGAASGDLTGTYPAPTLANNAVTTAKISDASVTAAKLAPGVIPTSLPPNGAASGDLSGTYPSPLVAKLQGVGVTNTAPTAGQVLKFDGTNWAPGIDNAGGGGLTLPYSSSMSSASNLFSITNSGSGSALNGINSSTNANAYGILGSISSTTPGANSAAVRGVNSGTGTAGFGVWGVHSAGGIGVSGVSASGSGVKGSSTSGYGLEGFSNTGKGLFATSNAENAGFFDVSTTTNGADAVFVSNLGLGNGAAISTDKTNGLLSITNDVGGAGVLGVNMSGGEAVIGRSFGNGGTGLVAQANAGGTGGNALVAELMGAGGNTAVFKVAGANVARINDAGKGFFNGGTQMSGADVAEYFAVEGTRAAYEPGDVLVISADADRTVTKSTSAYSTLIAGVYATKPGVLLTEANAVQDQLDALVPMGVIGVIPTKVCMEGGAIKRGDLIVTSSTPGVAMKADPDKVRVGQVLGKALQDYNSPGVGKINILVSVK